MLQSFKVETCSPFTNTIFDSPDRYNPFIDTNSTVSANYKRTVRIEHSISGTMMAHHPSLCFLITGKHRSLSDTPRALFFVLLFKEMWMNIRWIRRVWHFVNVL